jgi:hypothetical protein
MTEVVLWRKRCSHHTLPRPPCGARMQVEEHAAKAHDVIAIKCRGAAAAINFDPSVYDALAPLLSEVSSVSGGAPQKAQG